MCNRVSNLKMEATFISSTLKVEDNSVLRFSFVDLFTKLWALCVFANWLKKGEKKI